MFLSILKQRKGAAWAMAAMMSLALSSCDSSFVYEDLRPCVPEYRVKLSYDYNMSGAQKVSDVHAAEVYAFDKEGKLAAVSRADRQTLIDNDWTLPINLERFQDYDLVVWGGLTDESPFSLDGTRAVTSKEDLTCRLGTETDASGRNVSSNRFPSHLFHSTKTVRYEVEDGPEERTVDLIKNTNLIDVLIRSTRNEALVASDYNVEITDVNGVMGHDNSVSGEVVYLPARWLDGDYNISDGEGGYTTEAAHAVVAEMHHGRLMADSQAELLITRADNGEEFFRSKLIDLFMKLKNRIAPGMDLQEYLDRQDYYRIDLVLTTHVSVYINGYRIIENNMEWY